MNEVTNTLTFRVEKDYVGLSLKEILYDQMKLSSRLIRKLKTKKNILVNGNKIPFHAILRNGDVVQVIMEEEPNQFEPEPISIEVVYEDLDLLIVNKKPGIVVHPTKGHPTGTMANAIVYYMQEKKEHFKIRFINRLDRDTSGLIMIAKNPFAQQEISKQMQANKVQKMYVAVVDGNLKERKATINAPIGRREPENIKREVFQGGQESITHYEVIDKLKNASVVKLKLETGRTHQIRVHMSYIGHPLIGDELYGVANTDLIDRQALHAQSLIFYQPRTNQKIEVNSSIPEDMEKLIKKLKNDCKNIDK
ncbi:RluA family pseudouridine synthase [Anaerophilus nitritogenes]|uniref:RluA family pseudouridine synthase n=1 Tax=Anaerophilus nitritogenes TaxID=2498136 RepID=UPI00101C58EA|nr:RluA family pseudouridine synthase [Anaerophilus nitritogenes]